MAIASFLYKNKHPLSISRLKLTFTMSQPTTRQELYDRIRETSKDEFVLSEMKRLGFWEKNAEQPTVAEQVILRESELHKQYNALATERNRLNNQEAMLKEIRKKRMEESRRKREETKLKRIQQRKERSENWQKRQKQEINYLGENVSKGLHKTENNDTFLVKQGLPIFKDALALSKAMNTTVGEIRWLSFSRNISQTSHYQRFTIAKKTGGARLISAPMPRLKSAQHWILEHILKKVSVHEAAHGFMNAKSIVTNANPHLGADIVVNMDMKNFFPTITYERVKGVFRKMGYSQHIATLLALICTEPDILETELDGEKWYVANSERYLPQGAPTSPMITNILCRKLDARLIGLSKKHGYKYTRYADDMTFSATGEGTKKVNLLLQGVHQIVADEGLIVHPDKTKIMRKGSRKEVTGITVNNNTPSVSREKLRQFRAFLHKVEKQGNTVGLTWGTSHDVLRSALGYARFVAMVQPEKGKILIAKVKNLIQKIDPNYAPAPRKVYPKKYKKPTVLLDLVEQNRASKSESNDNGAKPWWKFW
jgi:RNA-directed DNA polymerase